MDLEQVPSSEFEAFKGGNKTGGKLYLRSKRVLTAPRELADALCGGDFSVSSRRGQSSSALAPAHIQISHKISYSKNTYHRS
jgi:hypothetical protein